MRCMQKRKATKLFIDYIECKRAKLSINLCLERKRKLENNEEEKYTKKISLQNDINMNQSKDFDLRFFSNFLLGEPERSIANMNVPNKEVLHISADDKEKDEALANDSVKNYYDNVYWTNSLPFDYSLPVSDQCESKDEFNCVTYWKSHADFEDEMSVN